MSWSVKVYDKEQGTPVFVDFLETFGDVVTCVGSIATAFGERKYRLAFDVPESATSEEIDRLNHHGTVRVDPTHV
jgi:hypothetical protein